MNLERSVRSSFNWEIVASGYVSCTSTRKSLVAVVESAIGRLPRFDFGAKNTTSLWPFGYLGIALHLLRSRNLAPLQIERGHAVRVNALSCPQDDRVVGQAAFAVHHANQDVLIGLHDRSVGVLQHPLVIAVTEVRFQSDASSVERQDVLVLECTEIAADEIRLAGRKRAVVDSDRRTHDAVEIGLAQVDADNGVLAEVDRRGDLGSVGKHLHGLGLLSFVDDLVVESIRHRQTGLTVPVVAGCSIELVVPFPRHRAGFRVLPDRSQFINEHLTAEVVRTDEVQAPHVAGESSGHSPEVSLGFQFSLDVLAVLAEMQLVPLDRHGQVVSRLAEPLSNEALVDVGANLDLGVLLVPDAGLGSLDAVADVGFERPEGGRILCAGELAGLADHVQADVAANPAGVAGDVLDEVEGVVVLEVGAGDLHDVPCLDLHVVLIGHG
nr:MAG TPA: hypothetical protein [Caudoviricetes sp.]